MIKQLQGHLNPGPQSGPEAHLLPLRTLLRSRIPDFKSDLFARQLFYNLWNCTWDVRLGGMCETAHSSRV